MKTCWRETSVLLKDIHPLSPSPWVIFSLGHDSRLAVISSWTKGWLRCPVAFTAANLLFVWGKPIFLFCQFLRFSLFLICSSFNTICLCVDFLFSLLWFHQPSWICALLVFNFFISSGKFLAIMPSVASTSFSLPSPGGTSSKRCYFLFMSPALKFPILSLSVCILDHFFGLFSYLKILFVLFPICLGTLYRFGLFGVFSSLPFIYFKHCKHSTT